MTYHDIKTKLQPFDRVLVCGPQRSGTQFAAKTIARLLRFDFVPWHQIKPTALGLLTFLRRDRVVWHQPAMTPHVPLLATSADYAGTAVVYIDRELVDVHASEHRIGWGQYPRSRMALRLGRDPATYDTARFCREAWAHWQKEWPEALFTLAYDELKHDPRWVAKEDRKDWGYCQTERTTT